MSLDSSLKRLGQQYLDALPRLVETAATKVGAPPRVASLVSKALTLPLQAGRIPAEASPFSKSYRPPKGGLGRLLKFKTTTRRSKK